MPGNAKAINGLYWYKNCTNPVTSRVYDYIQSFKMIGKNVFIVLANTIG